jgi:hypothetical protein
LAASLLVHLVVVALLLLIRRERSLPPPPSEARPPELEIEIAEVAQPAAEAPVEVPGPQPLAPKAGPPSRRRTGERAGLEAPGPPAPGPVEGGEAEAKTGPSGPGAAPEAGAPDLSLGVLPGGTRRRLSGSPPEGEIATPPHKRPSVDEMRIEVERQRDAVANVEKGRVDPVLYDILRGARARVESEARRLAESLPLGPSETTRGWARGYLQNVEREKRPGKDRAGDDTPDLRTEAERQRPDVLDGYNQAARAANLGAEERWSEVCLDFVPGREPVPTLRRSSGTTALDRLALDAFARAIAARPLPADLRPGLACYEMRISAFRMPPLPVLSCGYGETGFTCVWPFKRITSVKGRLLSVDRSASEPKAAKPPLLRRPR